MSWRYYAQRILGGTWLDRDVELYDVSITWALSGPGALTAKVDPIAAKEKALDGLLVLEEWSTAIYAEADGQIRWGGILHTSEELEDGARSLEFVGFTNYPKGRVYQGEYRLWWEADPFDVVRWLWAFVQTDAYANIGMVIDSSLSGYKLGDPIKGPAPRSSDYATTALYDAAVVEWTNYAGEAYQLAYWNSTDCGDEIDNVMQEADAAYTETHTWTSSTKQGVTHNLNLYKSGYPRRRNDLRFVEGENIAVPPYAKRDGDAFATQVLALGAGEERFMLRKEVGSPQSGRLRRDKVVSGKDVMSYNRLEALAREELAIAQDIIYFDSFKLFDHPNAPIGSFAVGDEIHIQTFSGFQTIDRWVQITEYTLSPEENDQVSVTVTRV